MPFSPYAFSNPDWNSPSSAFGGFSSPADQYAAQQLKINPKWNGAGPAVAPGSGATDPLTGLPATTPKPATPATGFTPSPNPTTGNNAFGYIPGQLGLPDPAADLGKQIPGLQGLNAQASGVISDYLGGRLPPDVINAIQDSAARFGVSSGMPGSRLAGNRGARDLGLTSLDLQNKGLAAYGPFVGAVSATQVLNPALQSQIAEQNAVNAAAPDPTMAASYAKQLYDKYLAQLSRNSIRNLGPSGGYQGSGGPAGGTGAYSGYSGGGPQQFLPHVNNNLSYTPGAFDFSSQFSGDSGYGNSMPIQGGGAIQSEPGLDGYPTSSDQGGNSNLPWWDNGSYGVLQNEVPYDYFNNLSTGFDYGGEWFGEGN